MHPARFVLPLGLVLGAALAHACGGAPQDECSPGLDACPCADGGLCLDGLQCIGGYCQAVSGTTHSPAATGETPTTSPDDTASTAGPDPSGSPTTPTTTTTNPDPDSTSDTATSTSDTDTTTGGAGPSIPAYVWHELIEFGEANDVEFTPEGQVAVVGQVEPVQFITDGWIGVFSVDGELQWEHLYDGTGGAQDVFHGVAVHPGGQIYIAGTADTADGNNDVLSITYNAQGVQQTIHTYNDPMNQDDVALGVAVDSDGNPFVCGYQWDPNANTNAYLARYADVSGDNWSGDPGYPANMHYDCKAGPGDYFIVASEFAWSTYIQRFDADSDHVFYVSHYLPSGERTYPMALAIDPADESIYVSGRAHFGDELASSSWLGRWDFTGKELWTRHPVNDGEGMRAEEIVIDEEGWVRVVGSTNLGGKWSVFILTYDSEGNELDRTLWSPPDGEVRAHGAAVRGDVLFIVGGTSFLDSQIMLARFAI